MKSETEKKMYRKSITPKASSRGLLIIPIWMAKIKNRNNTKYRKKIAEKLDHSHIAGVGGMKNDTATLANKLAISYKTKHTITVQHSNYTFRHWSQRKLSWHKTLYTNIHSSFFVKIIQNWKQLLCFSINERVNNLWYALPWNTTQQ